jgi:hypothetical protein
MKTPARNQDIKALHTGLSGDEIKLAVLESRRLLQIRELGERYMAHPANAPERGTYNPWTGARLA